MNEDIMEEVPLHQITQILETFQKDLIRYFPLVQYIQIHKEYKESDIEEPKQTLLRYGDIENGVYIVESIFSNKGTPYNNSLIYTASQDTSTLEKVLSQTCRLPWNSRGCSILAVSKSSASIICQVARSKGIELKGVDHFMVWLPPGQSVSASDIPQELELKYLNSTHVQEVYQNWPNKFPGSEFYLEQQLKNHFGLGLFRKSDEKMVSSALSHHSGGIFVLFTDADFRGKGYAEIIVQNMSLKLLQQGRIPFAMIRKQNIPSQNFFKKIGFQIFSEVELIFPKDF